MRLRRLTADNPLVTEEGIRCYAGIPLLSSRGHVLGTESRAFVAEELAILRELARRAVERIEARRR